MDLKAQIDLNNLPRHIAIIMDGNGRWAKQQGKMRVFGHRKGVQTVREITEAGAELGIRYMTLYAFSTENWARPKMEVTALMELLVNSLRKEMNRLMKNKIRLRTIGEIDGLPGNCYKNLLEAMETTKDNDRMDLVLALNYGSKGEIVMAFKKIAEDIANGIIKTEDIDEKLISSNLYTKDIPNPELLIRTSGEQRLSNFLLWQMAYAEFVFSEKFWPDFTKEDLYKTLIHFQNRERRFGKISEQIQTK
ncbi:MAG: isoprenyl transferase [Chitinophagales bacterium]